MYAIRTLPIKPGKKVIYIAAWVIAWMNNSLFPIIEACLIGFSNLNFVKVEYTCQLSAESLVFFLL